MNTNTTYAFFVGGGFSLVAYLIGGFDNLITSLAIMMAVDFTSGVLVGAKMGYEQNLRFKATGIREEINVGVSSNKAFFGLMKKTAMILAIVVAVRLDLLVGNEGAFMRNAMIMFFIGMEGISFVENSVKLGIKLPPQFTQFFEQMSQGKNMPKD